MLLQTAMELFLASKQGVRKDSTVSWYRGMLTSLSEAYPTANLEEITPEMLDLWRAALAGRHTRYDNHPTRPQVNSRGLTVHTLHGHIRAVRTFFRFCHQRRYIDRNPSLDLHRPRLPAEPPKHITDDDLDKLLAAAADNLRDYTLVLVLASTGCRVGGLAGLQRSAVDLKAGVILCQEKFDKTNEYYLTDQPLETLRRWLQSHEDDAVFPSHKGGALTGFGIYQVLARLAKKAGIDTDTNAHWNPHAFRHHKAREILNNGGSLEIVGEILHHEDIGTTAHYYTRWTKKEVQEKHTKFSRKDYPQDHNSN